MAHEGTRPYFERALIALFIVAIALPMAGKLLPSSGAFALTENRRPAELPTIDFRSAGWRWSIVSFPRRFERYWNDSFGFRWYLIRAHSLAKLGIGSSPSAKAIIGRDGWLYYAGERSTDYFRNVAPFSDRELARWRAELDRRHAWLAERGIRYLIVVAPNKETIYPEYMPPHLTRVHDGSRLDQLLSDVARRPGLDIVDLRAPLLEARKRERVYHRTDTHWNDAGALVAKRAIVERLQQWLPGIGADDARGRFETRREPGGDLARLIALEDRFPEDSIVFVPEPAARAPLAHPTSSSPGECTQCAPVAVMNHDSFGEALIPFLRPHFSALHLVEGSALDRALIERERPAVVIQEFVERVLMCEDVRGC